MNKQGEDPNNNAAQEALKKAKKETSSKIMQKVASKLIPYVIPVVLIILAGALLLGVFDAVGRGVQDIVNDIINFFTIDHLGVINVSDTEVDTIINGIIDMGVSLDGLKLMGDVDYNNPEIEEANREAMRKYIKAFYEAQAITQTPNAKPRWYESWTRGDSIYGNVYIYRTTDSATTSNDRIQLRLITEDEMNQKWQNKASDIEEYFAIDTNGRLVVATSYKIEKTGESTNTQYILQHIDYKGAMSQYTTQMNFFLYLAMVTENPEFALEVSDLVKDSKIDITIMENVTTTTTKDTYKYKPVSATGSLQNGTVVQTTTTGNETSEVTETKQTQTSIQCAVTYAKVWFGEQSITYQKEDIEEVGDTQILTVADDPSLANDQPKTAANGATETWKIDKSREVTETKKSTKFTESSRSELTDLTGERNDTSHPTFINLLDKDLKIPNTKRYEKAGQNFVSGAQLLLYMLQKDSNMQSMEQVIRYILYKYTGRDYGITDFSELENYFRLTTLYASGSGSLMVRWTGDCTRQEFIDCVNAFTISGADPTTGRLKEECYPKYFQEYAEEYYDICTQSDIMVDPRILFAIGCLESGYGTSDIANDKGNFWGWGAFDTDAYGLAHSFTEVPDGIEEVARGLNSYMTPGTESYNVIVNNGYDPVTMQGVASRYCPGNPNYASTIKSIVKMIFGNTHFSSGDINASEMQERIVSIIKNGEVQPVSGYCAAWVYDVYARAGQTRVGKCCANQARLAWAISMDQTSIPLGACVYAGEAYHSNTICSACGTNARHVAIYIGDGMVASPEGYIRIMTLDQFISIYSWGGWGWNGGIDYSI